MRDEVLERLIVDRLAQAEITRKAKEKDESELAIEVGILKQAEENRQREKPLSLTKIAIAMGLVTLVMNVVFKFL